MSGQPCRLLEDPQISSQKESGLLEEQLGRHGRLEDPIFSPSFTHNQPRPLFEVPLQISDQKVSRGQLERSTMAPLGYYPPPRLPLLPQQPVLTQEHVLTRHGQFEHSTMAPLGYPPHLPLQPQQPAELPQEPAAFPQEPVALPPHSKDSSKVPALERAVAELLEEEQRQQAVDRWIAQALSASSTERILEAPERLSASAPERLMSVSGSGGINMVNRDAAAPASLVQQQQVATTSWVAQAELAGLALPPDLIRESALAAQFALRQMQEQSEFGECPSVVETEGGETGKAGSGGMEKGGPEDASIGGEAVFTIARRRK
ncbi:unnamed protein product [Closterium sp. NIES-65]|nr:unnamed protein product [Closterium sp. NIES-65]